MARTETGHSEGESELLHWIVFWITVGFLIYFSLNFRTYTRFNRALDRAGKERAEPVRHISVLIPARNEEHNIGDCLRSILHNKYPSFEVILMDDGSTDATSQIAKGFNDPRLRVLCAPDKPDGWVGKNWACHQLSLEARHPILLYMDADTRLTPDALWRINAVFTLTDADVLSGCPKQIPTSFLDRVLLPIMPLLPMATLPLFKIGDFRFVRSAIHGAFIVIRKDFYQKTGGYETIKGQWVDDAALNKVLVKRRSKTEMLDMTKIVSCRMYTSPKDTIEGFARSLYHELFGMVPLIIFLMAMLFLATIVPFLLLIFSRSVEQLALSLWAIGVITGIVWVSNRKYGFPWYSAFLLPLMFFTVAYTAYKSIQGSRKKNMTWKGRPITDERPSPR